MDDWRNPDDYKKYRNLKNKEWAWEFLRRNPYYRERWEQCRKVRIRHHGKYRVKASETQTWAYNWHLERLCDPAMSCFDVKPRWRSGLDNPVIELKGEPGEAARFFPPPVTFTVKPEEVVRRKGRPTKEITISGQEKSPYLVLAFDVRRDVIFQLDIAKAMIQEKRKEFEKRGEVLTGFKSLQKKYFPLYLRLLDARNEGVGNAKIISALPEQYDSQHTSDSDLLSEINKQIAKAREISSGYYHFLYASSDR